MPTGADLIGAATGDRAIVKADADAITAAQTKYTNDVGTETTDDSALAGFLTAHGPQGMPDPSVPPQFFDGYVADPSNPAGWSSTRFNFAGGTDANPPVSFKKS